jgi:hypothetical protein
MGILKEAAFLMQFQFFIKMPLIVLVITNKATGYIKRGSINSLEGRSWIQKI